MIKIWYDYDWGAVNVKYGDVTIRMLDKEDNTARNEFLEQVHQSCSQDGGNLVTPFSKELWDTALEIGTILHDA